MRIHLRVQREYPNERLIPRTVDIKRHLLSAALTMRKSKDIRLMRSLSNENTCENHDSNAEIEGSANESMPFPVEYSIGLYNSLMNLANKENLHWLVEAYYREAMELKYSIPCYIARSDVDSTEKVTKEEVTPSYVDELASLEPGVKAKTTALSIEIEALSGVLDRKIKDIPDGDTDEVVHHVAIRMSKLCENLAQEYIAAGALLAAVEVRERGYRACPSPTLEFSIRMLGSLGVLSRIAGAKTAADRYFVEMQAAGKLVSSELRMSPSALGIPDGVLLDLAYFTAYQADLYRTNGYHKKANKLLMVACRDLESHYGSEYEHPISAATKYSYYLSLVGSLAPVETFFKIEAAVPPFCGTLDIDAVYPERTSAVDVQKTGASAGSCPV